MKFGIRIMPKKQLLDVQGRAVESFLKEKSFQVQDLRIGKYIEMNLSVNSLQEGQEQITQILKNGLYNPLVEVYEFHVIEESRTS